MTSRLILVDSHPEGGAEELRHALERHLTGSFQVTTMDGAQEGFRYFNAIKPALLGRAHVILIHTWYPYAHKLEGAELQMLERAALTCGKVHIVCRSSLYRGEYEPKEVMDVLLADDHSRIEFDVASTLHRDLPQFISQNVLRAMYEAKLAPSPYVGNFVPGSIALVAEQPKFVGFSPPYISFRKEGVSWWLADGMRRAKIKESALVWVNSTTASGEYVDPSPLIEVKPRAVFAMGDQAVQWCKEYGISHIAHKTPLWWKKHQPGKPYPLVNDLVKTVKGES